MLRKLTFVLWLCLTAVAFYGTVVSVHWIASDSSLQPFRTAAKNEIIAATERLMARAATAEAIEGRLQARLAEMPRNWLALDALTDLAHERSIDIAPDLTAEVGRLRDEDFSYLSQALSCAACAFDPSVCSITEVMLCQAPVAMTPVGDIAGVIRAGVAYAAGGEVDKVDLALSVVGLGATVFILSSGGSSAVVKAGAGLAKAARKMGRLSPRLIEMASRAVAEGVDWAALPGLRSLDDLARIVRSEAFSPLAHTLTDLGRLRGATDATTALHLLPLVDNADDARHLANVAEAIGPKVVGRVEILGKVRLFRAALRVTKVAWALLSSALAFALCLAGLVASLLEAGFRRRLRRLSE